MVPGAHAGRGRGNAFLNDLCDADVLVHVVDASGRSDREGVDHSGGGVDGDGDAASVASSIRGRRAVGSRGTPPLDLRKRASEMAVGAPQTGTTPRTLHRVPLRAHGRGRGDVARGGSDPKALTRETVHGWTEADLHLIVAHFLRARFPVLLALNKTDLPGAGRERRRFASDGPRNPPRRSARYAARGFEGYSATPSRWDESPSGSRWRTSTRARRRAPDATRRSRVQIRAAARARCASA